MHSARADDRATLSCNERSSGHPLHRLVEVQVQGVAAVRRNDQVVGLGHRPHGIPPSPVAGGAMHREQLPRVRARDLVVAVDGHVEAEVDPGQSRYLPYGVVDGIALR